MNRDETLKVQDYLRRKFRLDTITVEERKKQGDSAEVLIGDEFIGVIYKDEDEGEVSYQFNMAILDFDLDE